VYVSMSVGICNCCLWVHCWCVVQTCETRVSFVQSNRFIVSVVFTNMSSTLHIKDIDLNVLDSLNTKLMRGVRTRLFIYQHKYTSN